MNIITSRLQTIIKIINAIPNNLTEIHKQANMTQSHVTIFIKAMEKEGIVKSIKTGRVRNVTFTETGKELRNLIVLLEKMLS